MNLSELTEQIDTLRDNMSFIQDNINECQNSIVHMEEFKVRVTSLVFDLLVYTKHSVIVSLNFVQEA